MKIIRLSLLILILGLYNCNANPGNLKYAKNFLRGLEKSEELDKPIFLNFTGYGCIGYDEFMNDLVTSNKIQNILNSKFITIQLYVDDRKEIQKSDTLDLHKIHFSKEGQIALKKAKTVGEINSAIEIEFYKTNIQPYYVIMDAERNNLIEPFGYTHRNRELLISKLEKGLEEYELRKE